jgi:hypothetical protein
MPLLLLPVQMPEHPQKKEQPRPPVQLPVQLPALYPQQAQLPAQQLIPQLATPLQPLQPPALQRLQLLALLLPLRLPVQPLAFQMPVPPIRIRLPTKLPQLLPKANHKRLFKPMPRKHRHKLNRMQLRSLPPARKPNQELPHSP